MTLLPFQRRVGAAADVSELEFIAALHQTSPVIIWRQDATISSLDIVRFLKSRFGLDVPHAEGIRIVRGLGGGGDSQNNGLQRTNPQESNCTESSRRLAAESKTLHNKSRGIHLLETLIKSLWRRLFRRKTKSDTAFSTHHEPKLYPSQDDITSSNQHRQSSFNNSKAKVLNRFGGSLPSSFVQQLSLNERDNHGSAGEMLSTIRTPEDSKSKVLVQGSIRRLSSSFEENADDRLPSLQHSPDDSRARVLMHVSGSLESIRELESSGDVAATDDELPTNRILDYSTRPQSNRVDNDEEYLDLVQVMAILLMPALAKAGTEWKGDRDDEWTGVGPKNRTKRIRESPSLPQTTALFANVLSFMLESLDGDSTSSDSFPTLNTKLVRDLLIAHGEYDRAADSALVEQMVEAAHSSTFLFDEEALVNALTSDLSDWDSETEGNIDEIVINMDTKCQRRSSKKETSHRSQGIRPKRRVGQRRQVDNAFFPNALHLDVSMHSHTSDLTMEHDDHPAMNRAIPSYERPSIHLDLPVTAIDSCVNRYSSIALAVTTFILFLSVALTFASILQVDQFKELPIWVISQRWLLFSLLLMVAGYVVIGAVSIGNIQRQSPLRILASLFITIFLAWIPPMMTNNIWIPCLVGSGSLCSILLFARLVGTLTDNTRTSQSSSEDKSTAATRKVNSILKNAYELHDGSSSREETMMNFSRRGARYEEISGGLGWAWRSILSGKLLDDEGIWIATRLYIMQFVQLACIVLLIPAGLLIIRNMVEESRHWRDTVASGDYDDWIFEIVPSPRQVKIVMYTAFTIAFINMFLVFRAYVPSYIKMVLQYRCGILPSLKSSEYARYRNGVRTVYKNIGNAAWGMLGSGVVSFVLVSLVALLFMWPPTRGFMRILVAWVLAHWIASLGREIVGNVRGGTCNGFFRTNPRISNLLTLGLECGYLGLGGGALVCRVSRLLFDTAFSIGCINVSSGNAIMADNCPFTGFVADLLQHEAHRHPYMERLAAIYVRKLDNDLFSSDAGACWRQLFVLSLMPWLSKYRMESRRFTKEGLNRSSFVSATNPSDHSFVFMDAHSNHDT